MAPSLYIFILSCLCTVSNSLNLLQTHFPKLTQKGDEFVLHFYKNISPFTNHNNGYFIQQVVLLKSYSKQFRYSFNRHIAPANIIITPYKQIFNVSNQTVFWTLRNLFIATDTVVFYIENSDKQKN